VTFIDLKTAFDSVGRKVLVEMLRERSIKGREGKEGFVGDKE